MLWSVCTSEVPPSLGLAAFVACGLTVVSHSTFPGPESPHLRWMMGACVLFAALCPKYIYVFLFLWALAPCLALSPCLIHALAGRTLPAGERGSAAGSLLSSHHPKYTWTCVLCRPSPELPFFTLSGSSVGQRGILRSIHLLSCTYNTSYVRILVHPRFSGGRSHGPPETPCLVMLSPSTPAAGRTGLCFLEGVRVCAFSLQGESRVLRGGGALTTYKTNCKKFSTWTFPQANRRPPKNHAVVRLNKKTSGHGICVCFVRFWALGVSR
jgi:hypothetical protein